MLVVGAPWVRRARLSCVAAWCAFMLSSCAAIDTDPSVPVSIEALPWAFPSVAIGDSLRDTLGVVRPVRAVVRNVQGEIIADAPVRFLYVQSARDSALEVDSLSGTLYARKKPTGSPVQIAARFQASLQLLMPVKVTNAPDTAFRTDAARLVGFLPDTVERNVVAVEVRVQYRDSLSALRDVGDWLVRFAVVSPPNPTNDTTQAVFFLDEVSRRPSQIDTTQSSGRATRRLRVRPTAFPSGGDLDTVVVEAVIMLRGKPIQGAPVRILVPVCASSTRGRTVPGCP